MDGCWYQLVNSDNDWEHQPRKDDGTFTFKDFPSIDELKRVNERDLTHRTKPKTTEELYGEDLGKYKGMQAIKKLIKERKGHVKAAFSHKDIGNIDLIWGWSNGDKGAGLFHIIERRISQNQDLISVLREMNDVIKTGNKRDEGTSRILEKGNKRVVIGVEYKNNKVNYIITAYEKK